VFGENSQPALVTFNGSVMNLATCTDSNCQQGLIFGNGFSDPGLNVFNGVFPPTVNVGETFAPSRWTLTQKQVSVPESSSTLALVGFGLSMLTGSLVRRKFQASKIPQS
jgi:hypothetical protein